jgi:predicted HTH transcriptional regulator
MEENPKITISELAKVINLTTRTIEKNISNLKSKGLIERVGTDKDGYWKINIQAIEKFSASSEKILLTIEKKPMITISELAELTNLTTRTIEKNISNLKSKGLIERVGADKGGYWKIKTIVK